MWECELDYYRMDVAIHSTEGQWLTEWKSGLQKHFKFILIFIYNLFSFVSFIFVYHREDPRRTEKERRAYTEMVKEACRSKDKVMMKEELENMKEKKMKIMYNQDLEMKDYVKKGTLYSARKTWEVRSNMLDVAGNYPGHNKYKDSMWRCQACDWEVKEDQEHLMVCEGYKDLQGDADLGNEADLVEFYSRVMERRKEEKWD